MLHIINIYCSSSFIQECLAIWARSPKAYAQLRASGMLLLPCEGTLCLYKNSITQKPGVLPVMFEYMVKEAELNKLPPHGYSGGILFDEMSIQVGYDPIYIINKINNVR